MPLLVALLLTKLANKNPVQLSAGGVGGRATFRRNGATKNLYP